MNRSAEGVTVVMPNYNKGPYTAVAVQSFLAQTWPAAQLIFVDDHSTDGSDAPAREAAKSGAPVRVLSTPHRQSGGGVARNVGLQAVDTPCVMFVDSDDYMDPTCLFERMAYMEQRPRLDWAAWPMGVFHEQPGDTPYITNVPKDMDALERFVRRDQPWLVSGPLWRTDFLRKLGGFDPELISQQDADLHIRALLHSDAWQYVHEPPRVHYRLGVESIPRRVSQSLQGLQQRMAMLLRHMALARDKGKLGAALGDAFAQYLLDLACMLRWHAATPGVAARAEALQWWGHANGLVAPRHWRIGKAYIVFKHRMGWQRFPRVQRLMENYYRRRLGRLIFAPSNTLCKSTWSSDVA